MKEVIVFVFRGLIERAGNQCSYHWLEGYSETTPEGRATYPWMGKRECYAMAKRAGMRAKFIREENNELGTN